jgi:hypothetical protein
LRFSCDVAILFAILAIFGSPRSSLYGAPQPEAREKPEAASRNFAGMSLASGRSQRQLAPSAKKNALAQLAELKRTGVKRSDQFEVRCPS